MAGPGQAAAKAGTSCSSSRSRAIRPVFADDVGIVNRQYLAGARRGCGPLRSRFIATA